MWPWEKGTQDRLDLYYAADANSPTWTFITTLTPNDSREPRSFGRLHPPAGNLQAVGRFRYQGSASPCTTGNYDDHDDLVFAVQ